VEYQSPEAKFEMKVRLNCKGPKAAESSEPQSS
jgi:hypothetical protein